MKLDKKRQEGLIRVCMQKGREAAARGDSPFGAVLVDYRGEVAAMQSNTTYTDRNTAATVEINLIRQMSDEFGIRDLSTFSFFANAAPSLPGMLLLLRAGIRDIYYGAPSEPAQAGNVIMSVEEVAKHAPYKVNLYSGVLESECAEQVSEGRMTQRTVLLNS